MAGKKKSSKQVKVGADDDNDKENNNSNIDKEDVILEKDASSNSKDDDDDEDQSDGEEGDDEAWDIVQVLKGTEATMICKTEECNDIAVAVWESKTSGELWPLCEKCQEEDFGGWPDEDELPKNNDSIYESEPNKQVDTKTKQADNMDEKELDTTHQEEAEDNEKENHENESDNNDDEEDEEEEKWNLKKVMSIAAVHHEAPIKCQEDGCKLCAAVLYEKEENDPTKKPERWYGCLDCQEEHFDGWPETLAEIPIANMTDEHKQALIDKCSKYKTATMPVFPESPTKDSSENTITNTVTPPPNSLAVASQNKAANEDGKATVTPMPQATLAMSKKPPKKAPKQNKAHVEMHRKWQAAAEEAGGPGARLVLNKAEANKLIYDFLYDSFCPMNINQIFKGLKAVIPSPVLNTCLKDMTDTASAVQFDDSDDEDESKEKEKSKTDSVDDSFSYKASLSFKSGKGANSNLYYVNYNTAKNGDGLPAEEKNKLYEDVAKAQAQVDSLKFSINTMATTTKKLLGEPTNEQARVQLEKGEAKLVDLKEQLQEALKLKVNEKIQKQTKRQIEAMASIWRKRRRMCMDFLIALEENSDGSVSAKKCLSGSGQIEIDSDETAAKAAIEYAKTKRNGPRSLNGKKFTSKKKSSDSCKSQSGIPPSASFVAVHLSSQGIVERVHIDA